MKRKIKLNPKGFTLVEVLMAGLIMLVAGMSAAGFASLMSRTNSTDQTKVDILSIKAQMAQNLSNERIWLSTVANSAFAGLNNRLFRCFRLMPNDTNHDCTQGEELILYSPDTNAILYDGRTAATQGFSSKGQPCNTFNPTTADPNCPIKFNLRWQPICPVAVPNCPIPQVQINADFIYNNTVQSISVINDVSAAERISFASVVRIRDSMNPVAVNDVAYTNMYADNSVGLPAAYAGLFTLADSKLTFDPSVNDYTETGGPVFLTDVVGSVVVTATTKQATTTNGGTALIDLTTRQITYTPPLGFYGIDSFNYEIQDAYGNATTGNVRMKVMTPYTWTGFANNTNMTDPKNWCGKVVAGTCDGTTNLITLSAASQSDISHLVFDDTCENTCTPQVNTDIQVKSIEIRNFIGSVSFSNSGIYNLKLGWDNLSAHPAGHQDVLGTKTFDGTVAGNPTIKTTSGSFIQRGGVFNGSGGNMFVMGQFVVLSGTFQAPINLEVQSHWRTVPASFQHNNGTVLLGTNGADPMSTNMTCVNGQISLVGATYGNQYWCLSDSGYSPVGLSFNHLQIRKKSFGQFVMPSITGMIMTTGLISWPTDPTIINDADIVHAAFLGAPVPMGKADSSTPNEGYFLKGAFYDITVQGNLTLNSVSGCAMLFDNLLVFGSISSTGNGCGETLGTLPQGGGGFVAYADSDPTMGVFYNSQLKMVGGANVNLSSDSVNAKIPRIVINKLGAASVTFGNIVAATVDFKVFTGVVICPNGSLLSFANGSSFVSYFNPGNGVIFQNVDFLTLGYHLKNHMNIYGALRLETTLTFLGASNKFRASPTPYVASVNMAPAPNINKAAFFVTGNITYGINSTFNDIYNLDGVVVALSDNNQEFKSIKTNGFHTMYVKKTGGIFKINNNTFFPLEYYHIDGDIDSTVPVNLVYNSISSGNPFGQTIIFNEYDTSPNRCFSDLRIHNHSGFFLAKGTNSVCVNGNLSLGTSKCTGGATAYHWDFTSNFDVYGNLNFEDGGVCQQGVIGQEIALGSIRLLGSNNVTLSKDDDTLFNPFLATLSRVNLVIDKSDWGKVTLMSNFTNDWDRRNTTIQNGVFDLNGRNYHIIDTFSHTSSSFVLNNGLVNFNGGTMQGSVVINGGNMDLAGATSLLVADGITGLVINGSGYIIKNGGKIRRNMPGTPVVKACPTAPVPMAPLTGTCIHYDPTAIPTPELEIDP